MDRDSERLQCSFCSRPKRLIFALQIGEDGNICDLCVLDARHAKSDAESASRECSFCGKSGTGISLASESAAICQSCARDFYDRLRSTMPVEDFLLESQGTDLDMKMRELVALLRGFMGNIDDFNRKFDGGELDWNAHNEMAKKIPTMKGKAGIMGLEDVSEALWHLESAFQGIHFDDIESNRAGVGKLTDVFAKLVAVVKTRSGAL